MSGGTTAPERAGYRIVSKTYFPRGFQVSIAFDDPRTAARLTAIDDGEAVLVEPMRFAPHSGKARCSA